jgi:hypothetical protein
MDAVSTVSRWCIAVGFAVGGHLSREQWGGSRWAALPHHSGWGSHAALHHHYFGEIGGIIRQQAQPICMHELEAAKQQEALSV